MQYANGCHHVRLREKEFQIRGHLQWTVSLLLTFFSAPLLATPLAAQPPEGAFGFNGVVSGFPTGVLSVTGGGAFDLNTGFVRTAGGFSCLEDVGQGPLSFCINPDDPGPSLAGEGVRWDTAELLSDTSFKCTGAASETP